FRVASRCHSEHRVRRTTSGLQAGYSRGPQQCFCNTSRFDRRTVERSGSAGHSWNTETTRGRLFGFLPEIDFIPAAFSVAVTRAAMSCDKLEGRSLRPERVVSGKPLAVAFPR